jgi:heme-degrading monooxygenase HmoA
MLTAFSLMLALAIQAQPSHATSLNPNSACEGAIDPTYCADLLPMIDSVDPQASLARLHELIARRGWPTQPLVGGAASSVALNLLRRVALQKPHTAPAASPAAVARLWRGRVPTSRASEYEHYLAEEGMKKLYGTSNNLGAEMLRRDLGNGSTEFVVISYWPNRAAIRAFAGSDIEEVHDLPRDHEFLIDPEKKVVHYDIEMDRSGSARP